MSENLGPYTLLDFRPILARGPQPPRTRDVATINTLWVHHTATSRQATSTQLALYHVRSKGWPTIGYTYVIYPNGTIAQTLGLNEVGYHVAGTKAREGISLYNWTGVGVALIGNFVGGHSPSADQMQALGLLIRHLRGLSRGVHKTPWPVSVNAHAESDVPTTCPGTNYRAWLDPIRYPIT